MPRDAHYWTDRECDVVIPEMQLRYTEWEMPLRAHFRWDFSASQISGTVVPHSQIL